MPLTSVSHVASVDHPGNSHAPSQSMEAAVQNAYGGHVLMGILGQGVVVLEAVHYGAHGD